MLFISRRIKRLIPELSQKYNFSKENTAMFIMGMIVGIMETELELLRAGKIPNIRIKNPEHGSRIAADYKMKILQEIKTQIANNQSYLNGLHNFLKAIKSIDIDLTNKKDWFFKGAEIGSMLGYSMITKVGVDKAINLADKEILPSEIYKQGIRNGLETALSDLKEVSRSWETMKIN